MNCGDRGNNYLAEERRGGLNPDFGFAEKNVVPKTYNGTGQIIPKKEPSPPKKKETVATEPQPKKVITSTPTATKPSRDIDRPKKTEKLVDKVKEEKSSPSKQESNTDK